MISPNEEPHLLSSCRADQRRNQRDIIVTTALRNRQEYAHRPLGEKQRLAETSESRAKSLTSSLRPSYTSWTTVVLRQVQHIERSNATHKRTAEQFYQWLSNGTEGTTLGRRNSVPAPAPESLCHQQGCKNHQPTEYARGLQEEELHCSSPAHQVYPSSSDINLKSRRDIVLSSSPESVEDMGEKGGNDGDEGGSENDVEKDCCSVEDESDEEGAVTSTVDNFDDHGDDEDTAVAVATMIAASGESLPSVRGVTSIDTRGNLQHQNGRFVDLSSSSSSVAQAASVLSDCHLRMLRVQENAKLKQRQLIVEIEFLKHQLESSRIDARRLQLQLSQTKSTQAPSQERVGGCSVPTNSLEGPRIIKSESPRNDEGCNEYQGIRVELETALKRQHSLLKQNLQLKQGLLKCGCDSCFGRYRAVQRREKLETKTSEATVADVCSMDPTQSISATAREVSIGALHEIPTLPELTAASKEVLSGVVVAASSSLKDSSIPLANESSVIVGKNEWAVSSADSTSGSTTSASSTAFLPQSRTAVTDGPVGTFIEQLSGTIVAPIVSSVQGLCDALGGEPDVGPVGDEGGDGGAVTLSVDLDVASADEAVYILPHDASPRDATTYYPKKNEALEYLNRAIGKRKGKGGSFCYGRSEELDAEAHVSNDGDIVDPNSCPTDLANERATQPDTADEPRHYQEPDATFPRKMMRSGSRNVAPSSRYGRRSRRASASTRPSLGDFLAHESGNELEEPNQQSYRGLGESVSVLSSMSRITFKSVDEDITVDYSAIENIAGDSTTNVDSMADVSLLPIEEPPCDESFGRPTDDSGSYNWQSRRPLTGSSSSITFSLSTPNEMGFSRTRSELENENNIDRLSHTFQVSDPRDSKHNSGMNASRSHVDIQLEHLPKHSTPRRGRKRESRLCQHGKSGGVHPMSELRPRSSSEDLLLDRVFADPLTIIPLSETTESTLSLVNRPAKDSAPCNLLYPSTNQQLETDAVPRDQRQPALPSRVKPVKNDDLYNNAVMVAMEMRKRSSSVTCRSDSKSDKFLAELSKCMQQNGSVRASWNEFTSGQPHPAQPLTLVAASSRHDVVSLSHRHRVHQPSTYDDALMEAMRKESTKLFLSAGAAEESASTVHRRAPSAWKTTSVFKSWTSK